MNNEKQIILDVVGEISGELSPHHPNPTPTTELEVELGLGSLERLELIRRLEKRLGRTIEEQPVFTARYVSDLFGELNERIEARSSTALNQRILPKLPRQATSLLEALQYQNEQQGREAAYVLLHQDQEVATPSYAELLLQARKISAGLQNLGVQPGDKVAIMLPTSVDFFAAFFGILNAGAVAVPLYPPVRLDQFEDFLARQDAILGNCQAGVLVTLPQFTPITAVLEGRSSLNRITSVKELSRSAPASVYPAKGDEVALLQYTSGSTGNPKGVPLTHRNLLVNIWAIGEGFGISDGDVMVSWLPLYHDMGLIGMALVSFVYGCPLVVMGPDQFHSRPSRWLRAFSDYKGSMTAAPNFAYAICAHKLEDSELQGLDLSSWRLALNGAEPVIPSTVRAFNRRFEPYGFRESSAFPAYGLAEATLAVSFTPQNRGLKTLKLDRQALHEHGKVVDGEDEIASCGRLVKDMEVRIVDENGAPLPEGHQGHLEIRGDSVMSGYLGHEPVKDWLRVGDLGFFWEEELYITGRSKDLIVVAGRNIHPSDLEAEVGRLPGVRPGCVAAVGIESDGTQKVLVLAEVRKGASDLKTEIQRCVSHLASVPCEVALLPPRTLPKTPSGKIRRQESKKRFLNGNLKPPKLSLKSLATAASGWVKIAPSRIKRSLRGIRCWAQVLRCWVDLSLFQKDIGDATQKLFRRLGVSIKVEGEPFGAGPLMVVSNHASLLDALAILATWRGEPLRFAMAESAAKHPLLKGIAQAQLLVRRGKGQAGEALQQLTTALDNGACLAVFPEGGIEHSCGLRGFAIGAFQACVQSGARLQPVAISGSRQILPQGEWIAHKGEIRVTYLPVIEPGNGDFRQAAQLSTQAREQIASCLPEAAVESRLVRND